VVDADPARLARILVVLETAGYAVTALDSASDAHVVVERLVPAVIVLDLDLPYRSGRSLLFHLKATPLTASIPVIGLTAAPEQLTPAGRRLLAALVPAPAHPDALRAALHRAVSCQESCREGQCCRS
jgi:CheY-like chemotaxis protein